MQATIWTCDLDDGITEIGNPLTLTSCKQNVLLNFPHDNLSYKSKFNMYYEMSDERYLGKRKNISI